MISIYKCTKCGKRFYFSGKERESLEKYNDAASLLLIDFGLNIHFSWNIVQKIARCCEEPEIHYSHKM